LTFCSVFKEHFFLYKSTTFGLTINNISNYLNLVNSFFNFFKIYLFDTFLIIRSFRMTVNNIPNQTNVVNTYFHFFYIIFINRNMFHHFRIFLYKYCFNFIDNYLLSLSYIIIFFICLTGISFSLNKNIIYYFSGLVYYLCLFFSTFYSFLLYYMLLSYLLMLLW